MAAGENTRLRGMLGFAMRAGKVTIGTEPVLRGLSDKKPPALVLLAADAAPHTAEKVQRKCAACRVPLIVLPMDGTEIGALLGKTYAPVTLGICDARFAHEIGEAVRARQTC